MGKQVDQAVEGVAEQIGVIPPQPKPEPKAEPAKPVTIERPQSALNLEKKQRLMPKFEKIKQKVDAAKEKAQV